MAVHDQLKEAFAQLNEAFDVQQKVKTNFFSRVDHAHIKWNIKQPQRCCNAASYAHMFSM